MAATVSAASGPRYAPEDPTLPKPWKGLIDGKSGFLYYWNPETNITQYEKPVASSANGSLNAPLKPASSLISSSVQINQPSQRQYRSSIREENGGYDADNNGGLKPQGTRGDNIHSDSVTNGSFSSGNGGPAARGRGTDVGSSLSVESYSRQHEITVSGDAVPSPFMSFETTGFPAEILREVQQAGFSAPTPIQAQSWPIALQGRDIVAVAKTGSGKTLGYLVPGFIHLKRCQNNSQMGPTILVLSPTRELATQIQAEAVKFGRSSRISCTCLYGGAPKGPQLREIERGVDIVVATPGRLNDILEMRKISLRQVSYLVLDEADRMLDMGFEPQIRKIVEQIPPRRQTLMYTATWPKEVRKIAADLLVKPVQVNIGSIDELVANKSITQYVEMVPPMEKQRRLEQILRSQEPGSKVIIFCSTKKMCDQLTRSITRHFGAAAIHGDKSQGERDYVLNQFRSGKSPILVATDVAARGLDVKDIRIVVNYDFPTGVEDYVHRIGRTGRAGATGVAYTFFSDQDAKHAADLIKVLEGAGQQVPPQIRDLASRGGGMNKFRRWGSAPGGGGRFESNNSSFGGGRGGGRFQPNNSGYGGGRSNGLFESNNSSYGGGRGGRAPPSSDRFDRDHIGRGYDREPRDRYNNDARPSFNQKVYGANNNDRHTGERGRSRSPNKARNGGLGSYKARSRSRSRSLNRDRSRSRSLDRYRGIEENAKRTRTSSPPHESRGPPPAYSEEEEEGMIPADA